jgi:hypothetical protein
MFFDAMNCKAMRKEAKDEETRGGGGGGGEPGQTGRVEQDNYIE